MSKLFTSCLLVQEGSTAPELKETEVNLHPGQGFPPDQGQSTLLAGGFSSISLESGFPLSSTLQLNYDLTTTQNEDLKKIAIAELNRINDVSYRSYTVEPNKRLCVLGSSAAQLHEFIDTYGGVLDITPLLTEGYDQDLTTALELKVESGSTGCRLDYQVRSPINLDICSYCGDCGPACPELCISETLFVDFNKCTFCKECEKVCDAGAIDMHSAVYEVLEVPAVLFLDEQKPEDLEASQRLFSIDKLQDYFSSLFPCQVDEIVTCDNTICHYSGRLGFGCDLCHSNCRYGAITLGNNGVEVDALKCEECGACVAACPTGAMQNERFSDSSFSQYLGSISIPKDGTVVLGDNQQLQQLWWKNKTERLEKYLFIQYENVRSLSLFHFLWLLNLGARRVLVLADPESSDQHGLNKQVSLANEIISRLFECDDAVNALTTDTFAGTSKAQLAGSFGGSNFIAEFQNRRASLAVALEGLVDRSGTTASFKPQGYIPFATVSCDGEKCTECMACINECLIGAMCADESELVLSHVGAMCVGCGICARVCPENALSLSPEFQLIPPFFKQVELSRAEPMNCKKCGKIFGTKKSFDRVMAILQQKEAVDTSHFEYCDTCRVVKLFETE